MTPMVFDDGNNKNQGTKILSCSILCAFLASNDIYLLFSYCNQTVASQLPVWLINSIIAALTNTVVH